ncbi:Trk family potassium uptake protein [candidate division WOR-3 bacterium]|nr:Trk family potassium uptake protein [candidate division WOR-3 bacterium]
MRLFKRFTVIRTERELSGRLELFRWVVTVLAGAALLVVILKSGYGLVTSPLLNRVVYWFNILVVALFAVDVVLTTAFAGPLLRHLRRRWFDFVAFVPIVVALAAGGTGITFVILRQAVIVFQWFAGSPRFAGFLRRLRLQPVRLLALSFLGMVVVGTLLLTFPAATAHGRVTGFTDALFTATSATCVTGLIVRDTPVYWSRFGQVVILCLLQLGGLGIMTFSSSMAVVFGRRLGMTERKSLSTMIGEARDQDIARMLRYILGFTLLAEAVGALLLFVRFLPDFARPSEALYCAVFHSVSAFCNAGFSVFSDSLVRYRGDLAVNFAVITLVLTGGLGFVVVRELLNRDTLRRGPLSTLRRLSVHARLVLWTSGLLLVGGTVVFFFAEYNGALGGMKLGTKLLASAFQAVTPRTAGFNTADISALRPVTLLLWSVLMFIGASPGGTGGGIKTSTVAVLFLAVRNRVLGREDVDVGRRLVMKDIVYRATSIAAVSAGIVTFFFAVLLVTEQAPFQAILFETVSAFGTVGLSTGLTPGLSGPGKIAVTALMYIGRLGPLTLALAMRTRQGKLPVAYPEARVMVG